MRILMLLMVMPPLATFTVDGPEVYDSAEHTQSIFVLDGQDTIRKVAIDEEWTSSGGMEKIDKSLWRSEKFREVPGKVRYWIADIAVDNGRNFQNNRGIKREYPIGTKFHDVLTNHLGVRFEHRVREKLEGGKWRSRVIYTNEKARPKGYTGLAQSCASCHDQAGTGKYGSGLVPGGDTVLSDPLDWSIVR